MRRGCDASDYNRGVARPPIVILTAVAMEARAIARSMRLEEPRPGKPTCGSISGLSIEVHVIGIGAADLDRLALEQKPAWLIMAGLAGALDPALAIGDIVADGCPPGVRCEKFHRGVIHTSSRIEATVQEKASLYRATGAAAVDMETEAVRKWAAGQRVGLIAIRAISDRADQRLDPAVLRLVDRWGRPRAGAILATIIRKPHLVRDLLRIGRDSRIACQSLATAVGDLVFDLARITT